MKANKFKIILANLILLGSVNYTFGQNSKIKAIANFKENLGQVSDQNNKPRPDVLFLGTDGQLMYHLKNNGISYQLSRVDSWKEKEKINSRVVPSPIERVDDKVNVPNQTTIYRLDINWLNINPKAVIKKSEALDGFDNYYLSVCPDGVTNVKSYSEITYQQLYFGIDLKWYQKDGHLKYDYIVAAGADYKQIKIELNGAQKIVINKDGELVITTPLGNIIEQSPLVIQNGKTLTSKWVITNNLVTFDIENINPLQSFIIDPAIRSWGTYCGGTDYDEGRSCTTDALGNVYLIGRTISTNNIATSGSHQSTLGGTLWNAFLVKFDGAGVRQWGTYYGAGNEYGTSCTADVFGNIYLTGATGSTLSITTNGAHQSTYGGSLDAFLVKFNGAGTRLWGTYYGEAGYDKGYSCITDASGNVYLTGETSSTINIATNGVHQSTLSGSSSDGFLVKFDGAGVRQWGTYYGGNGVDYGFYCNLDASGNIYLTGATDSNSSNIATSGSHQSTYGGGSFDAFLVKFNGTGIRQWSTYYGGSGVAVNTYGSDGGSCVIIDALGNIYMVGTTTSNNNIATSGSYQSTYPSNSIYNAFMVKFNSAGVRQWGTYYGGPGGYGNSCAFDASGNIYIVGSTGNNALATVGSHQTIYGGAGDAYIAKFNPAGSRLWASYYGGADRDEVFSCAVDGSGNLYLAGTTASSNNITTISSHQSTYGGGSFDAFLVKFNDSSPTTIESLTQNQNQDILVFPNPNNGTFIVKANENINLNIINETGQVVQTLHLNGLNNQQAQITNLTAGIYFIVGQNNYQAVSQKIIVTN